MPSSFLQDFPQQSQFLRLLTLLTLSSIIDTGSTISSTISQGSVASVSSGPNARSSSRSCPKGLHVPYTASDDPDEGSTRSTKSSSQTSRCALTNLPVELGLKIFIFASCQSQSTYRSLLLTCRSIHNLIRLEIIPLLPITLTSKNQMISFSTLVTKNPEIAPRVRYLWMIAEVGNCYAWSDILQKCTSIVSLACHSNMLIGVDVVSRHTQLRDLTMREILPMYGDQDLYNQIDSLHIIEGGGGYWAQRMANYTLPIFANLRSASISIGARCWIPRIAFEDWLHAPKLKQLAFVTSAHKADVVSVLAKEVEACGNDRYTVSLVHTPKRLTEKKLWQARVHDRDVVWKLKSAKAVFGITAVSS
ncbi:hypothetical protein D9758_002825 [Tetrapyrgos nigripes]|uniref:Uncharacterized protein n=1 Tax=Tetrapyrgos nigripes TaxID=182062 RepID=A0A8H5GR75_9AGAR|nr:hypothetical protein D9758_002825 [Tetrapyrgos nigripes]